MQRISRLRRQFARSLGIVVPPIQVRDNLRLQPTIYSILLRGTEVANGELRPGHWLAIDPGGRTSGNSVPGIPGTPCIPAIPPALPLSFSLLQSFLHSFLPPFLP